MLGFFIFFTTPVRQKPSMPPLSRICRVTGQPFDVSEEEQEHIARAGKLHPLVKEALPLPTIHPYENLRRLGAYGNLLYLYKTQSAYSGNPQISRFFPEFGYKICTLAEFWNEEIDNREFGRDYDFSRPFFAQFSELLRSVYLLPLVGLNNENSPYVNGAEGVKNCHLCFNAVGSEDCTYCLSVYYSNDCTDCVGAERCQFCYSCLDCANCYTCRFCQDCATCSECFACLDCTGCSYCIGCVGLQHAEYCIYNETRSREEVMNFLSAGKSGALEGQEKLRSSCAEFIAAQRHSVKRTVNIEDCSGNYLANCKNSMHCYFSKNIEDCGYVLFGLNSKSCWRAFAVHSELLYQAVTLRSVQSLYSYSNLGSEATLYTLHNYNNCSHLFGSVGLNRKSYCILNKQYSKAEFYDLVPRIIAHMKSTGEWGEFFPPQCSYHCHEESLMDLVMQPITSDVAGARGYRTVKLPESSASGDSLDAGTLPGDIAAVLPEKWAGRAIRCSQSGSTYNFQRTELEFYKRFNIPLPRVHWRERLRNLVKKRELMPTV